MIGDPLGTILIVDDSSLTRKRMKSLCASLGFEAETLSRATAVPDRLEAGGVLAILLDLHMPEMEGTELLDLLKEKDDIPPIVVVTADLQKTTTKICLEKGARCVLNKPVDADQLDYILREIKKEKEASC